MQTTANDLLKSVEAKLQLEGIPGCVIALDGVMYQWMIGTTPLAQLSFNADDTIDLSFVAPPDRYVEPWENDRIEITAAAANIIAARIGAWIMFVDESPKKPA